MGLSRTECERTCGRSMAEEPGYAEAQGMETDRIERTPLKASTADSDDHNARSRFTDMKAVVMTFANCRRHLCSAGCDYRSTP